MWKPIVQRFHAVGPPSKYEPLSLTLSLRQRFYFHQNVVHFFILLYLRLDHNNSGTFRIDPYRLERTRGRIFNKLRHQREHV